MSPQRAQCQKYIPSPSLITDYSLLTTHYHADTMLTSSLDVLHTLWCRLVCRNSVKLNLVKTGLKSKFGVNIFARILMPSRVWSFTQLVQQIIYTWQGECIRSCNLIQSPVVHAELVQTVLLTNKHNWTCPWGV